MTSMLLVPTKVTREQNVTGAPSYLCLQRPASQASPKAPSGAMCQTVLVCVWKLNTGIRDDRTEQVVNLRTRETQHWRWCAHAAHGQFGFVPPCNR
jgi:hypothetical protein